MLRSHRLYGKINIIGEPNHIVVNSVLFWNNLFTDHPYRTNTEQTPMLLSVRLIRFVVFIGRVIIVVRNEPSIMTTGNLKRVYTEKTEQFCIKHDDLFDHIYGGVIVNPVTVPAVIASETDLLRI